MNTETDEKPRRDKIHNRERAQQINSFEGLNLPRKGIPTDIDGFIEYCGKLFINFEGKYKGVDMKFGQKLSFEHLVQSHTKAGNTAFCILYEHETPIDEDVIVAKQLVSKVYDSRYLEWREPKKELTVQECINSIINYCQKKNIINLTGPIKN